MGLSPSEVDLDRRVQEDIARGELTEAATQAIRGYGPQILAYLMAILRDRDDADDAFGRFTENLWSGMAQFRGESSFKAWAYKIAWHAALRVAQDPHRVRGERLATSDASRLADAVRSAGAATRSRMMDRLARVREQLAPDERTMIILRFDRRLSWREVAGVLAESGEPIDETALRKRFERLKQKLRKLATAEGLVGG